MMLVFIKPKEDKVFKFPGWYLAKRRIPCCGTVERNQETLVSSLAPTMDSPSFLLPFLFQGIRTRVESEQVLLVEGC